MSTVQPTTVEQAKKVLREARLTDHMAKAKKALERNDHEGFAKAASAFVALYRNKGKKVSK